MHNSVSFHDWIFLAAMLYEITTSEKYMKLEKILAEGLLIEVSLDETTLLWKSLQAFRTPDEVHPVPCLQVCFVLIYNYN